MDQMDAFDRQLASVVLRRVGPSEPVNDSAIFNSITAGQSPKWRFQTMFSATRFITAAAIVALFGGFLLAGALTTPQGDEVLPAAVTESPSPMTTEEMLAGMVTEDVEPGVFRIVSDGVREVSLEPGAGVIAVGPDGTVWLCIEGGLFRLGDAATSDIECPWIMEVAPDGTLWADDFDAVRSFDGTAWVDRLLGTDDEYGFLDLATAPDGVWVLTRNLTCDRSASPCRLMEPVRVAPDGSTIPLPVGFDVYDGPMWIDDLAVAPNGDLWLSILDQHGGWDVATLLRHDGSRWAVIDPPDGVVSQNGPDGQALDIAPDGTLWIGAGSEPVGNTGLARLDDSGWTVFSAEEGVGTWGTPHRFIFMAILRVAPDGSVWVNASGEDPEEGGCGGVARFDGTTWTDYLTGVCVDDLAIAPDGAVWVFGEADDTAYRGTGFVGLFVITPEAVTDTE